MARPRGNTQTNFAAAPKLTGEPVTSESTVVEQPKGATVEPIEIVATRAPIVGLEVAPTPVAIPVVKYYRVLKEAHVSRGASHYVLAAGKVISTSGYDIERLKALGVPLEETSETTTAPRARIIS